MTLCALVLQHCCKIVSPAPRLLVPVPSAKGCTMKAAIDFAPMVHQLTGDPEPTDPWEIQLTGSPRTHRT